MNRNQWRSVADYRSCREKSVLRLFGYFKINLAIYNLHGNIAPAAASRLIRSRATAVFILFLGWEGSDRRARARPRTTGRCQSVVHSPHYIAPLCWTITMPRQIDANQGKRTGRGWLGGWGWVAVSAQRVSAKLPVWHAGPVTLVRQPGVRYIK